MCRSIGFWICAVISCIYISTCSNTGPTDQECRKDLQNSEACYTKEFEKMVEDKKKWRDHTDKISHCFNESKCDAPALGRNPLSDTPDVVRKIGNQIKEEWSNTSDVVKQCIKKRLAESIGEHLKKCLSEKNVENFNLSQFFNEKENDDADNNPLANFITGDNKTSAMSNAMKKVMVASINVVRSIRICNETKNTNDLNVCVKKECASIKDDYCEHAIKCRAIGKANSLKSDCQSRGETIYKALCQCKQEKLREMVDNLDRIRNQNNITLGDMMEALSHGHDIRDYLKTIRQCYQEHDEHVPPIVSVAMAFGENLAQGESEKNANTGDKRSKKQPFMADKATVEAIRDFLASQCFDEEECTLCQ